MSGVLRDGWDADSETRERSPLSNFRAIWVTPAPQTDQQIAERIRGEGWLVNWPWDPLANHDPGDEDRS